MYHQGCMEKFLKKYGFSTSRKVGFPCPRGRGKGTAYPEECSRKVERSHPIVPRNDERRKRVMPLPIAEVMAKHPKANEAAKPPSKPPALPRKQAILKAAHFDAVTARQPHLPALNAWQGANAAVRVASDTMSVPAEPKDPKPAHVPVGLVLAEAITKAKAMTKAHRKNLQRRKKKQAAAGADAASEAGSAVTAESLDSHSMDYWAAVEQHDAAVAGPFNLMNGINFVTDVERYLQLIGMQCKEDPDDEPHEEDQDQQAEVQVGAHHTPIFVAPHAPIDSPICSVQLSRSGSSAGLLADAAGGSVSTAVSLSAGNELTAAADHAKDPSAGDADIEAAIQASLEDYQVEQERQKQRAALAGLTANFTNTYRPRINSYVATEDQGFRFGQGITVLGSTQPSSSPAVLPFYVPIAARVSPNFGTPTVSGMARLHGYNHPAATAGYQQQAKLAAKVGCLSSEFGNSSVYSTGQYSVTNAAANLSTTGAANGYDYCPMATGHSVSSGDEDDDLNSLLVLCGVAG